VPQAERRRPVADPPDRPVGRAREQALEGCLAGGGLPQRREHLGDVAQEERVGTDDQDTLLVELAPVLVEQEGGAMQAHRRLPRARTALHHQARVERRPDDQVLLGRDGGDDVAHLAGPLALELGEQRVGDAAVVGGVDAVGVVEHLVEQVVELVARHHEPPPPPQPQGIDRGSPVEGGGDLGPPVDDHRLAAGVLDVATTDVPAVVGVVVQPTEAQSGHVGIEAGEPALEVPLGDRRVDRLGCRLLDGGGARRPLPHGDEAAVGMVDVGLFGLEIRVRHRAPPRAATRDGGSRSGGRRR
jgi:hypothetical protein